MNAVLDTPHTRSTAEWQSADAADYLHPFTDFKGLANKGSRVITRAENIYLWDSEGNKILDAMSGLWCVNVGYGRRERRRRRAERREEGEAAERRLGVA